MKKTILKGNYGYIASKRKSELIITIGMYLISLAIFLLGYISTGSNKNLLTIVAVLGILPASKRAVSVIMFVKAGMCTDKLKTEISDLEGEIRMLYDLYLTSANKNYQLSAAVIRNKNLVAVSEDPKCDTNAGEKHIVERLAADNIKDITVKIFSAKEVEKFVKRAHDLVKLEDETMELNDRVAETVCNISL